MAPLPASIRANLQVPFPALVTGIGPIIISKTSGIWQVSLNVDPLATHTSSVTPATDYLLVWDSVNKTFYKISIAQLAAQIAITIPARTQRSTITSPIGVTPTDQIINCNVPTPATCALPASATRNGLALTLKDLGQASTNNIVITANGAEKIDGLSTYTINNNRQSVTLVPFNDGVNSGWAIE